MVSGRRSHGIRAGVYSSFLLHAERAAQQFHVSAKEILLEVANSKAAGGQEDIITEIAAQLSRAGSRNGGDA